MKRAALIIAAALLLTAGCQSREASFREALITDDGEEKMTASDNLVSGASVSDAGNGPTTATDAAQAGAAADTADDTAEGQAADTAADISADITAEHEPVNDLDDFFKVFRPLKIQRKGDSTDYVASESLVYTFGDMISKVGTVDTDAPEGRKLAEGFDYDYYDYRLKFDGTRDILFTREWNVFHFEGEKRLYVLWGSADPLWGSLVFNASNNSVVIDGEKIRVMANVYTEDLNGDGKVEDIELVYVRHKSEYEKGDLIISINGSRAAVMEGYGTDMFIRPYRTVLQMPEIKFLPERDGKSKAVLVVYTWATNGVGSTGVVNAYRYVNGDIREIKIIDTERVLEYKGDNIVNVNYPAYDRSIDLIFDAGDLIGSYYKDEETFIQRLEGCGKHPLWYLVNDFNGDGRDDLCCVSFLLDYPFVFCSEYSYYEYGDGVIKPVQVYADLSGTDDEKMAYLKGYIFDLIHHKGYLAIGDNGIADENFQPYRECTPDEIKAAMEELQKDGILERKGARLYINY